MAAGLMERTPQAAELEAMVRLGDKRARAAPSEGRILPSPQKIPTSVPWRASGGLNDPAEQTERVVSWESNL